MAVEEWAIDKPVPYDRNPRVLTEQAIRAVANSITKYGWRQPIVVDGNGVIVVGHTRHEAAKLLGMETVPVHVAKDMSEAQIRAYRIADNKVAEFTDWEKDVLGSEMADLMDDTDLDLEDMGFYPGDLDDLFGDDFIPSLQPGKATKEVTDKDVSKAEDKLGKHHENNAKQELIEVICPHCGAEYEISNPNA